MTLASRLSGYLRDKAVAALIGAGMVGDAFVAGFRIPNMFRAFLAEGALSAAFVPLLAQLRQEGETRRMREFVGAMVSFLLLLLPLLVVLGVLAAPALVHLFAAPFAADPVKLALTVRLTRLMFPYLALISFAALAQGVLNTAGRFLLPAATPVALNLAIIAGAVTASQGPGGRPEWLAIGVLVGGALQVGMQWRACRRLGLPLLPGRGALRHPLVRRVLQLMLPGVPALGIYQVTILLSTRLAAGVGEGAVTCLYNASRINELVYGVVVVQLTTAVLPMLSAERAGSPKQARHTLAFAMRLLSLVTLPAAALGAVLAHPIAGALLGGGKYGAEAVAMTGAALVLYSLGMPFLAVNKLWGGASFAWLDTRTPVWGAAVNLGVFALLGSPLATKFGVAGVAGAAAAGQLANALTLGVLNAVRRRLPAAGEVLPSLVKHLVASAFCAVVGGWLVSSCPPLTTTSLRSLALLAAVGGVALAAYLAALAALCAPELREVVQLVRQRRERRGPGPARESAGGEG